METLRVRNKTVNLVLGTIRYMPNLAAREWRVEGQRSSVGADHGVIDG